MVSKQNKFDICVLIDVFFTFFSCNNRFKLKEQKMNFFCSIYTLNYLIYGFKRWCWNYKCCFFFVFLKNGWWQLICVIVKIAAVVAEVLVLVVVVVVVLQLNDGICCQFVFKVTERNSLNCLWLQKATLTAYSFTVVILGIIIITFFFPPAI